MSIKLLSSTKSFDGFVEKLEHASNSTKTKMTFTLYKPSKKSVGALMWLSGLTCNEDNFITKAGAIRLASELGIIWYVQTHLQEELTLRGNMITGTLEVAQVST